MRPAGPIDLSERDYFLGLHEATWPTEQLSLFAKGPLDGPRRGPWGAGSWTLEPAGQGKVISRVISRSVPGAESPKSLEEVMLRFPSCPLFGIQREREYQVDLDPVNYHTLRLLRPALGQKNWQAERIFLIFNGLNETDRMDFYYDLAGLLLDDQNTACIICPLPGHLMRYPMVGRFAEKPLNRFIADPSDLFRQYLRAILEAQWLLSILVPVSHYPVVPGSVLLGSSRDPGAGRCDSKALSQEIFASWSRIWESSARLLNPETPELKPRGAMVRESDVLQTVTALRDLIGWEPLDKPLSDYPPGERLPAPRIHVIGYSLGGYLAQSVFFTWPFAIGSCTTICSGGALQEIKPVKFAHEEEWRAVTNGLKYELESGMLERRIRLDDVPAEGERSVCGTPIASFSSFFRIFNDVFLQDSNGSYRSRVSEFAHRLLFMVGGNDPIVTTRSVIAASPSEGINLIEIANLSHFVAMERGEWGDFWLPALSKLLLSFAERTELLLSKAVLENLWTMDTDEPEERPERPNEKHRERAYRRQAEPLDSGRFQDELMSMVDLLSDRRGFLMILRNRIPTALMGPRLLEKRGAIPHFEDQRIRAYWEGLAQRREKMIELADRLLLILPSRLKRWFVKPGAILSAKSEPSSRSVPNARALREIWSYFLDTWENTGALYCFNPEMKSFEQGGLEDMIRKESRTPDGHPILNTLPDVWIGLSGEVVKRISGTEQAERPDVIAAFQDRIREIYNEQAKPRRPDSTEAREWIESGKLRVIRVSSVSSNPRFLGERIWSFDSSLDLLVHGALAIARSRQCMSQGDFLLD